MGELLTIRSIRSDGLVLTVRELVTGVSDLAADADSDQALAALAEGYGVMLEVLDPDTGEWHEVPGSRIPTVWPDR